MPHYDCNFCDLEGPDRDDAKEAEEAALAVGFIRIMVPRQQIPREGLTRSEARFLCRHCAKHARSHFLVEARVPAYAVLEENDEAFEKDTDW